MFKVRLVVCFNVKVHVMIYNLCIEIDIVTDIYSLDFFLLFQRGIQYIIFLDGFHYTFYCQWKFSFNAVFPEFLWLYQQLNNWEPRSDLLQSTFRIHIKAFHSSAFQNKLWSNCVIGLDLP